MANLPVGRTQHRPSWDEYFLKLAMLISERATCPRMHCGCVVVKNNRVLAAGYNGSIAGQPHCEDVGCLVENNHCVRTNHAEINALVQAAYQGANVAVEKLPMPPVNIDYDLSSFTSAVKTDQTK